MYLCDYHVHSRFSFDSATPVTDACETAIRRGIKELGFADHVDFYPGDEGFGYYDYEAHRTALQQARKEFGAKLVVRQGLEVDYVRQHEDQARTYLEDKSFDFIIGSVHYVDGYHIGASKATDMSLSELHDRYLAELEACIRSGLFDIIGHPDYLRRQLAHRFGSSEFDPFAGDLARVMELMAEADVVPEINVRPERLMVPSLFLLQRYREAGGKAVAIGSDAHRPEEIGGRAVEGLSLARQAGIAFQATYGERRRKLLPI